MSIYRWNNSAIEAPLHIVGKRAAYHMLNICSTTHTHCVLTKIFRRKDITLTRNRVIRICIQNTLVPPIAGYF